MVHAFSVLIPAAGLSVRMGKEKALLHYREGTSFADEIIGCYKYAGADPIVLVLHENFDISRLTSSGFLAVINRDVSLGRSWSVLIGLQQIPEGNSCFIHNIDNPFVETGILWKMADVAEEEKYVVPVYNGKGGHPVLLGSKVVEYFRKRSSLFDFRKELKNFTRKEVEVTDKSILWNINTPFDYECFRDEKEQDLSLQHAYLRKN